MYIQWEGRKWRAVFTFLSVSIIRLQRTFHTNLCTFDQAPVNVLVLVIAYALSVGRTHLSASAGIKPHREAKSRQRDTTMTLRRPTCQGGANHDIDIWF